MTASPTPEALPPHSIQAEVCALGSMILDAAAVAVVRGVLARDDFYRPAHQTIFCAIVALADRPAPVDLLTLKEELVRMGKLESVGGMDYVVALAEGVPDAGNIGYYADIVREAARKRELMRLGAQLADDARQPGTLAGALVDGIQANLRDLVAAGNGAPALGAVLRVASSITCRPLTWLWPGRIPAGKLTLIIGHPGQGKTLQGLDMAARLSKGTPWPDNAPNEAGSSIVLSGEDDPEDTLCPRLRAAGADLARVHVLDGVEWRDPETKEIRLGAVDLDEHMGFIRQAIQQTGARLFIIDPISSFVGAVDDHRNSELRALLSALAVVARDTGCAIVCISHLRKAGGLAVHQAVGSLAYSAAARAVWAVLADPVNPDRRLFLPVKANLSRAASGLAFNIASEFSVDGQPSLRWEAEPVALRADDVLNPPKKPGPAPEACEEAQQWLSVALVDGPRLAEELIETAEGIGITAGTLRRAKKTLGILAWKDGFQGPWYWGFSKDAPKGAA